jgi:hypothetical protein
LIVDATAQAAANSSAVQKAGDTMTGPLVLSGAPTQPNQAANKAYADTKVATVAGHPGPDVVLTHTDISDWTASLAPYALLASPALSGNPTSVTPPPGDNDTSIATTAFVNTAIAAQPGTVIAPTIPAFKAGQLWWDATGGSLYVGYDDGNTQTYVPATNITLPANVALKTDVATALNNVGRNLIHNSGFTIAQRGAGPFTTQNGLWTLDRWNLYTATDTFSVSQVAMADSDRATIGDEAAQFMLRNVFTGNAGAAAFQILYQTIEGVRRLSGKTVTLSFWATASAAGVKLGATLDQAFGSGGSPSATVSGVGQSVTLTAVWARYSLTFSVPSTAGKTLGTNNDNGTIINFCYSSGSNNAAHYGSPGVQSGTVYLWGVQLEIAQPGQTQPTPLEKRDPVYELQQCQRFYQTGGFSQQGATQATAVVQATYSLATPMRAPPLITPTYTATVNCSASSVGNLNPGLQQWITTTTTPASGQFAFAGTITASADL